MAKHRKSGLLVCLVILVLLLTACGEEIVVDPTPTLSPIESQGKGVFSEHCAACHAAYSDTVIVGPSLAGVRDRAGERVEGLKAEVYLELSITNPSFFVLEGYAEAMPESFAKKLTTEELNSLVAYLLSLDPPKTSP